jgi:response regulator RpfG family c-di-GMP phosphodiesterase
VFFTLLLSVEVSMSENGGLSAAVNQHYLDKVMDMTDTMPVHASEDIYDERGNKLLAKGALLSRNLQEKLIVHRLKKPLESSISIEGGVDQNAVFDAAQRLVETNLPLAQVLTGARTAGPSTVAVLARLKFGRAMGMMLTIADRKGGQSLDHAVTVSLLSIALAKKAGLAEQDQQTAGMAGLLHDVGELYIDPSYLVKGKRLLPHEWAHIVVHPFTGQMLIDELDSFPAGVGRAVAEHHERFDGSGYPQRRIGGAISIPGQIVAIAEMVAGVLSKQRPLERAALALKIFPGEHARPLLAAMAGALRENEQLATTSDEAGSKPEREDVPRLVARMKLALEMTRQALMHPLSKSQIARHLLAATINRICNVQRAIVSTGLDMYLNVDISTFDSDDPALLFEKNVATREIQWRLRDIARDLALQNIQPADRLLFVPIINLLDDDFSLNALSPGSSLPIADAPDRAAVME